MHQASPTNKQTQCCLSDQGHGSRAVIGYIQEDILEHF